MDILTTDHLFENVSAFCQDLFLIVGSLSGYVALLLFVTAAMYSIYTRQVLK